MIRIQITPQDSDDPVAEQAPTLYDADTRTVHYRDFAAEATARARLARHGVKQEWDHALGEPALVISEHKLGALIADVVRDGWLVDADGAEYRSAGPTRAVVRSGIDWFELDAGVRFGDIEVSLSELLHARRAGMTSILLPDGTHGLLPLDWLARLGPLTAGGKTAGGVIRKAEEDHTGRDPASRIPSFRVIDITTDEALEGFHDLFHVFHT